MEPKELSTDPLRLGPDIARLSGQQPSPLPRVVLYLLLLLFAAVLAWAILGRLDIVAVSHGKLVPQSFVKIVQPAEAGIVREILVREGDYVKEGQTLLRMDAKLLDADVRTVEEELARKRLQLRRIDAELSGSPLRRAAHDASPLFAQVEAQMHARRRAYADSIAAEEAVRARSVHDLESAKEIELKLRQSAPIYREQAQAWQQLAREGYAGHLLALDRQRTHLEAEQELKAQSRAVEGLAATIAQARKRIDQIRSTYRQQLHDERMEAETQYQRLLQESAKHRHRHGLLELKAPQAGVVKDLATHTTGTVLAPGAVVLTLVPQSEPVVAEVWIANTDAGFVQPGQRARIKLAAYPFQKYGLLDGRVEQISADSQDARDAPDGTSRPQSDLAYRARVSIAGDALHARDRMLKLVPGMAVTAEVHLGRRSVMEYLLSPIQKVSNEAGRER